MAELARPVGADSAITAASAATTAAAPGIVVKTVVGATTVYDAVVGKFLVGSQEDILVASCGTCLKLFRTSSPAAAHQADAGGDDEEAARASSSTSAAAAAFDLMATLPVDGTVLNLRRAALPTTASSSSSSSSSPTTEHQDLLVVVLEKMGILLLRFSASSTTSTTNVAAVVVTPVLLGRVDVSSPIALRADNGDMVVATNDCNIVAVHAHLRHLQLFFIEHAKDGDGGGAGARRPRTPDAGVGIVQCSLRLAEQQVVALAFLNTSRTSSSSSSSAFVEEDAVGAVKQQTTSNNSCEKRLLVVLYRDRRQAVHVSAYNVKSRDSITLVSKALVSHLERTASHLVPLNNNGGFAVCGATQVTIATPPTAAQQQQHAKQSSGEQQQATTAHRLNVKKSAKQLSASSSSASASSSAAAAAAAAAKGQSAAVDSSAAAPWNTLTVGYYAETPSRISTTQLPGAACSCMLLKKQSQQKSSNNSNSDASLLLLGEREEFVAVAINNGTVFLVDAAGKSKRAIPVSSSVLTASCCVFVSSSSSSLVGLQNRQKQHPNLLALFSTSTSATALPLVYEEAPTLTSAKVKTVTSSPSSSHLQILENSGPILSSAVTERQPTTELVAVSGAAAESTLCKYRSGASAQVIASIPDLEGLRAVHSAARSSLVMDVSVGLRHLQIEEDAVNEIERADCSFSSVADSNHQQQQQSATLLMCASVDNDTATLFVAPNKVLYSRVAEDCEEGVVASATWTPSSYQSNDSAEDASSSVASATTTRQRIVAAAFDPVSKSVVVALHGGNFVQLKLHSGSNNDGAPSSLAIVQERVMDFASCCITCSAMTLSPGGEALFFAAWGSPNIYSAGLSQQSVVDDDDAAASSVVTTTTTTACVLPPTCMAKSCCVLSSQTSSAAATSSDEGRHQQHHHQHAYLLLVVGTTDGRVFVGHLPFRNPAAAPATRVDSFSIGTSPVSLALLAPMVFPPIKHRRPVVLCCGDHPCYLLMNTIHHQQQTSASATASSSTTVITGVEPEVIHLAVGPLLSATQLSPSSNEQSSSSTVALVTKNRELQLIRPVTESLLHRSIARQRNPVSHVAHVTSQGVFVAATYPTSRAKAVVCVLNQQQSVDGNNNNNNNSAAAAAPSIPMSSDSATTSSSSSTTFELLENEVCASLECLSLQHRAPTSDQQQQQQQKSSNKAYNSSGASAQASPPSVMEHLVVATRRFGSESKAGGRLLLLNVEMKQRKVSSLHENNRAAAPDASDQLTAEEDEDATATTTTTTTTTTVACLKLVAECDIRSNAVAAVCSAFGHRLVVVAGGAVSIYSVMATMQQQHQHQHQHHQQAASSPLITLCPETSVRVSLCSTCASSISPMAERVFIGDALHSVAAVALAPAKTTAAAAAASASGVAGGQQQQAAAAAAAESEHRRLRLAAKEVSRRRILAVLALSDDTCVASDEAMNILLFRVGERAFHQGEQQQQAAAATGRGGGNAQQQQQQQRVDKCALMVCLGAWHLGDRITTLSFGSALAGGYTPGKWLRHKYNNNSIMMEGNPTSSIMFHGDQDDDDDDDERDGNNKRMVQDYPSIQQQQASSSSSSTSLIKQSIVAGTTCGSLLSLSVVDEPLRCFLGALTTALETIFPNKSRVRVRDAAPAESSAIFRAEHSFDELLPSAGGGGGGAQMTEAVASSSSSAHQQQGVVGGGTALFIDGDELERLHSLGISSDNDDTRNKNDDSSPSTTSDSVDICKQVFLEACQLAAARGTTSSRSCDESGIPATVLPKSFRHLVQLLSSPGDARQRQQQQQQRNGNGNNNDDDDAAAVAGRARSCGDGDDNNNNRQSDDSDEGNHDDQRRREVFPFSSIVEALGLLCRRMAPPVLDNEPATA